MAQPPGYPPNHVLYQSGGWISHIRFSPQGDKIAFMEHPALWDDRGSFRHRFIRFTCGSEFRMGLRRWAGVAVPMVKKSGSPPSKMAMTAI